MTSSVVIEETQLKIPDDFNFPLKPYQIQVDFMRALFSALDNKKLGIFESPTGTGKSLSLICASLSWLQQREAQRLKDLRTFVGNCSLQQEEKAVKEANDWISAHHAFSQKKERVRKATREMQFMEAQLEQRQNCLSRRAVLKKKWNQATKENRPSLAKRKTTEAVDDHMDQLVDLMLDDEYGPDPESDSEYFEGEKDEKEPEFHPLKVIFASRTHSQLSQFVNELKKTEFASQVTTASLGSRQNLCVNSEVTHLKSLSLINERCLDLQKSSKGKKTKETKKQKTCSGCPYFNQTAIEELKNQILCEPMDIEELVAVGRKRNACAYYASRKASKEAQLVTLPYNTILHSSTRDGIGLRMENVVIVLDEAHNIVESISNMYSNQVTLPHLQETLKGLQVYINRYVTRFSAENLRKLKDIEVVLASIIKLLEDNRDVSRVFYIPEFSVVTGIQNIDLFELFRYMTKSKLIFKLRGYLQQHEKQNRLELELDTKKIKGKKVVAVDEPKVVRSSGQAVLSFYEFFKSITKTCAAGRILQEGPILKFLMLDTANRFGEVVKTARSVILTGGTMKPYEDVQDQLFFGAKDRMEIFACRHVIPDENLLCLGLSDGATVPFDFTYKKRNTKEMLQDLSLAVLNISRVVPGGLVIFLQSYDYGETFYNHLKQSGILEKIEAKKRIFREVKNSSSEKVLSDYTRQIRNDTNGAALLAVVGGKLSEGINFGDDLGRCVIVVGLPYPNVTSVEIKEKIRFVSDQFGEQKGKELLTNACFKAVNQSIGRVIRHANDYATIVLMDARFLTNESQTQLPDWIRKKYQNCTTLGKCIGNLANFYKGKSSASNNARDKN